MFDKHFNDKLIELIHGASLVAQTVESACSVGDPGSIPGSRRTPGEGNGNSFQYPCLENSMDGGAWQAIVHGVTKSQKQLSNFMHAKRELEGKLINQNVMGLDL